MISKNITILSKTAWREIVAPVRERAGERLMNIMVDEKTGEIFRVSHRTTVHPNMVALPIVLKETKGPLFTIEPMDLKGSLPASIQDIISKSIHQWNQSVKP